MLGQHQAHPRQITTPLASQAHFIKQIFMSFTMCKSDFAQFPLREVLAEGKFPVIDYHSFASRFPLPVVPAEGTFPVLDYNKHFSQPPQPVWRAETLPADARDPRGRYCQ